MTRNARIVLCLLAGTAMVPTMAMAQGPTSAPIQPDTQAPPTESPGPSTPVVPSNAPVPASASNPQPSTSLGEIVVTAQRRAESLVNVPISITAVSGAALSRSGVGDTGALAQVVPGLHMDGAGAFLQPSIRGISSAVAGNGAEPNVATYVDGIYRPNSLANEFNFVDVDNVQVLKGPQGTLFGRNSTGGAILVTTRSPSFTPKLEVTAGYGSFNTFSGSLYASDRVTDKLAVAIAIGGENSDGFRTNLVTGGNADPLHDVSGRLKFLYKPTNRMTFTLSIDAFRTDDPDSYAVSSYKGEGNAALFGVPLSVGNRDEVSLQPGYAHIAEGDGVALKSEFDLGFATLTSYTSGRWTRGFEDTNEGASPFPPNGSLPQSPLLQSTITEAYWRNYEETYTQEFDLSSKGKGPFEWTVGAFGYHDFAAFNTFNVNLYGPFGPGGVLTGGTPNPTTFLFPASAYVNLLNQQFFRDGVTSESIAAFGDATYNINRWHFTIGGRYALDTPKIDFHQLSSVVTAFTPENLSAQHNFYALTPRGVVRYDLTPHSNLYVSYSEGTKSGLYNASGFATQQIPVGQERIRDVEGGYKVEGGSYRIEVAGFHYDYNNLQVATYENGTTFLQNAKKAEVYGFDAHFQKKLTSDLTLDTGLAYTHARYTDFADAASQVFSEATGVTNTTTDVSGGTLQRAPAWTGFVSADYSHELFGGLFALNATGSYQTVSSFDFADTLKENSHGILNVRADWTDPNKHWQFSVIGQNVTDTTYLVQVLANAGGFGATYGRPASVTGQISYKF